MTYRDPTSRRNLSARMDEDYRVFLWHLWKDRRLDEVMPLGELEFDVAAYAQHGPAKRIVLAFRFFGKALALDTPIPTPSGWTTMGDLSAGDTVFDEMGKPCTVTAATPIQHDRQCFRVRFSNGEDIIADADHQWSVLDRRSGRKPAVLTTAQMHGNTRYCSEYRYQIPLAAPLDLPHASLPIDPYILGVWLGDGHSHAARISFHRDDAAHYIEQFEAADHPLSIKPNREKGNTLEAVADGLSRLLRTNDLFHNKHIPAAYFRASVQQRLALLQGLVDTDGHITTQSGYCEIVTVRERLRDDILQLVRTLGFRVNVTTDRAKINGRDCGLRHRITFQADNRTPIARLARKADRQRPPTARSRRNIRTITDISPVPSVPVRCIAVDSPSRLYLAGKSLIPTHNTHVVTVSYGLWRLRRDPDTKIPIVSKSLGHSKDALSLSRRWIDEVPFLQHLHPENGSNKADTTEYFDVGPSRESAFHSIHAFGIGGQLTGKRGHVLIFDDIETPQNTLTHDSRQRLHANTNEFHHVAQFGAKEVIGVGTFHHEDTVYVKLQQEGYDVRSWPKVFPQAQDRVLNLSPLLQKKLDGGLALPGDITAPYRVTPEHIADDRKLGATAFGMQCALVCNVGETSKYPLRLSDIVVYECPIPHDGTPDGAKVPIAIHYGKLADGGKSTAIEHDEIPSIGFGGDVLRRPAYIDTLRDHYTATKAAVDPAGKGADRIGFTIGSSLHANVFLHEAQGLEGGARLENFDHIALTSRTYGVREIVLETNIDAMGVFKQMLEAAIRRHMLRPGEKDHRGVPYPKGWSAGITNLHSHGQKELRICTTLEPILGAHQLIVHPRVLQLTDDREIDHWQYQLTRMRRVPNCLGEDGKIDATQMLVQSFRHTLHADPSQRAKRSRDEQIKDQLDKLRGSTDLGNRKAARYFEHR